MVNPFPLSRDRRGGRAIAHHDPMEPFRNERVGLYRPRRCVCVAAALPVRHRRGDAHGSGRSVAGPTRPPAGAKQLLAVAQSRLSEQAAQQQQVVAGGLHALANELDGMLRGSEQDSLATDLARQAAGKGPSDRNLAGRSGSGKSAQRGQGFRSPPARAYLAIAAGAGILAGRVTRGLSATALRVPAPAAQLGWAMVF